MDFPCKGDGVTTVSISLRIRNSYDKKDIPGSPLTLEFDKECDRGKPVNNNKISLKYG